MNLKRYKFILGNNVSYRALSCTMKPMSRFDERAIGWFFFPPDQRPPEFRNIGVW